MICPNKPVEEGGSGNIAQRPYSLPWDALGNHHCCLNGFDHLETLCHQHDLTDETQVRHHHRHGPEQGLQGLGQFCTAAAYRLTNQVDENTSGNISMATLWMGWHPVRRYMHQRPSYSQHAHLHGLGSRGSSCCKASQGRQAAHKNVSKRSCITPSNSTGGNAAVAQQQQGIIWSGTLRMQVQAVKKLT